MSGRRPTRPPRRQTRTRASVLRTPRLLAYASESVLVVDFVYWLAWRRMRGMSPALVAALVTAVWVGEGLVLTVIGKPIVASELDREIAWYFWLVATGGPLQPAVAFGAGVLGARSAGRTSER